MPAKAAALGVGRTPPATGSPGLGLATCTLQHGYMGLSSWAGLRTGSKEGSLQEGKGVGSLTWQNPEPWPSTVMCPQGAVTSGLLLKLFFFLSERK